MQRFTLQTNESVFGKQIDVRQGKLHIVKPEALFKQGRLMQFRRALFAIQTSNPTTFSAGALRQVKHG